MRNRSLDLCKLICIVFVIISHYGLMRDNYFYPLVIDMAVPVFLIISGYVNSKSVKKCSVENYYREKLVPRLWRFLLPFFFVVIIESAYLVSVGTSLNSIIKAMIFGRWGDGSYYPYLLVQLALIFPFIYKSAQSKAGIMAMVGINLLFEIVTALGIVPMSIYRIAIFRCLGFVTAGVLIEKYEDKIKAKNVLALFLAGLTCAVINSLISDNYMLNNYLYTSIPIIIWPVAIVLIMLKLPEAITKTKIAGYIAELGKATYHILFVQMLYYYFEEKNFIGQVPLVLVIVISLLVGMLWHLADSKLQQSMKK